MYNIYVSRTRMYVCTHVMCGGAQAADGLYTTRYGRTARAGGVRCGAAVLRGGARGALRRGGAGVAIGQREVQAYPADTITLITYMYICI